MLTTSCVNFKDGFKDVNNTNDHQQKSSKTW